MIMIDQVFPCQVDKVGYDEIHAYAFDSNGMSSLHSANPWRCILLKGTLGMKAEKFVRNNSAWEDWFAPEKELSSY